MRSPRLFVSFRVVCLDSSAAAKRRSLYVSRKAGLLWSFRTLPRPVFGPLGCARFQRPLKHVTKVLNPCFPTHPPRNITIQTTEHRCRILEVGYKGRLMPKSDNGGGIFGRSESAVKTCDRWGTGKCLVVGWHRQKVLVVKSQAVAAAAAEHTHSNSTKLHTRHTKHTYIYIYS